jgi:tRNA pseudouridine38-40 synthase
MDSAPLKFKLTIAFDGARYAGWQVQPTGVGVQQLVESALSRIFRHPGRVHSSSRTDTGVHALGMVAHVEIPRDEFKMPVAKLLLAMNAHLPADIRIMKVARCSAAFHARFQARGKQYRYFVWNHPGMNPLVRSQAWHVTQKLEVSAMRRAAAMLVGRHDFKSFAGTQNYPRKSTVRTLTRCEIKRQGALFTFVIEGDGFLYKMCRSLVGTLIQVGRGKIAPEEMKDILACRDRRVGGMTAPAQGLVLWKVFYGRGPTSKTSEGRPEHDSDD